MPKLFSSATATNWQNSSQSVRHFDRFSLSVVIPAYNEELLLAEAVNNIADVVQSAVADYEIVIVNDGSVDSTLKIARSLAASQPHVIVVAIYHTPQPPLHARHPAKKSRLRWRRESGIAPGEKGRRHIFPSRLSNHADGSRYLSPSFDVLRHCDRVSASAPARNAVEEA